MDDLLKEISGAVEGQAGQAGGQGLGQATQGLGQLQQLLGGLGGGNSGSLLGGVTGTPGATAGANPLGSLGSLLPALLGLLGGQAGNNQTGLHQLVGNMQANGLGNIAQSWIGNGASQAITPAQVEQVLSSSQLSELAAQSGMPADQLKSSIAAILPHLVSGLSPNGSIPEPAQVQGMVGQIQGALGGLTGQH
jgi:uncharacterized protein YidB (DUF937 family)